MKPAIFAAMLCPVLLALVGGPAAAITLPVRKPVTATNAKANRVCVKATDAISARRPVVHFEIVRKFDPRLDGDEIRATLIVRHSDGKSFTFRGNVAPADKRGEKWEVEVAVDEAAGAVLTIDVPSPDGRKLDTAYEIHLGDF